MDGFGKDGQIKVTIHYTDLSQLTLKSARCTGAIVTDSLTHLYMISGSQLDATLDVKYCNMLMQSGSQANLDGICRSLKTKSESGSRLMAEKLRVEECTAIVEAEQSLI